MQISHPATHRRRDGFARGGRGLALLKALLAVAVIGELAAVAIPNCSAFIELGRVPPAMADIRLIERTIARFSLQNNGQFVGRAEDF